METIIRSPKGTARRKVKVSSIQVPDLWHVAMSLPEHQKKMVLETWNLCHDLLENIRNPEC